MGTGLRYQKDHDMLELFQGRFWEQNGRTRHWMDLMCLWLTPVMLISKIPHHIIIIWYEVHSLDYKLLETKHSSGDNFMEERLLDATSETIWYIVWYTCYLPRVWLTRTSRWDQPIELIYPRTINTSCVFCFLLLHFVFFDIYVIFLIHHVNKSYHGIHWKNFSYLYKINV